MAFKKRAQTSGMFLLELILAILFFAIVSSVCVRFFVKSHIYSRDAMRLSHSVSEVSSILEIAASDPDPEDITGLIKSAYPSASVYKTGGWQVVIWYDAEFTPCPEADAVYALYTEIAQEEDGFLTTGCTMYTRDLSKTIYTLTSERYIQEVTPYAE